MIIERKKKKSRKEQLSGGGLVYALGHYNTVFSESLIDEITELYNEGYEIDDIAETFNRPVIEIIIGLMHQADQEKVTRPFAYRRGKGD